MPETLGADTSTSLQTRGREIADIGERNQLLDTSVATTIANGRGTELRSRVNIILDHTDTIGKLIGVKLIPLIGCQGTLKTVSTVVIADFGSNDNTTEVSTGAGVQSGQRNTSLRNHESGERNTVAIQTRRSNTGGCGVLGNDENVGSNIRVSDGGG